MPYHFELYKPFPLIYSSRSPAGPQSQVGWGGGRELIPSMQHGSPKPGATLPWYLSTSVSGIAGCKPWLFCWKVDSSVHPVCRRRRYQKQPWDQEGLSLPGLILKAGEGRSAPEIQKPSFLVSKESVRGAGSWELGPPWQRKAKAHQKGSKRHTHARDVQEAGDR